MAHFAASCFIAYRADAVVRYNGLGVQRLAGLLAFVAVTVFGPAGMVGAMAAVASLRVSAVVTAWSLGLAEVDAADAVVWHDCLGVCEAVAIFDVFVGSS